MGAMHDFFAGVISVRHGGKSLPWRYDCRAYHRTYMGGGGMAFFGGIEGLNGWMAENGDAAGLAVSHISKTTLGVLGSILALLGVVAALADSPFCLRGLAG